MDLNSWLLKSNLTLGSITSHVTMNWGSDRKFNNVLYIYVYIIFELNNVIIFEVISRKSPQSSRPPIVIFIYV